LIIYTESDYLEAHLTEISAGTHNWSVSIDAVPQLLTDAFRKFASTSSSEPASSSKTRPS